MKVLQSLRNWFSALFRDRGEEIKRQVLNEKRIDHRKWAGRQTSFVQLNHGWNADPVDPRAELVLDHNSLRLEIDCSSSENTYNAVHRIALVFQDCWRYRIGSTNDEGWYYGQCRFCDVAPQWGEFYQVLGDLRLDCPDIDWTIIADEPVSESRHFLFYFKDETFECDALGWSREPASCS